MSELSSSTSLWHPGEPFVEPFREPGPSEFTLHFANTVWNGAYDQEHPFVALDASLAAVRTPNTTPTAVAILDLDDMVSNLGGGLRQLMYPAGDDDPEHFTHDYGQDMFFSDTALEPKYSMIRLIKQWGLEAVREIAAIRSMVESWRQAGVFVAFITSAIPGAELDHVNFIAEHFNQACDGVLITSGHYLVADKGEAAKRLVDFLDVKAGTPVVHLDDLTHNTTKVRTALQAHDRELCVGSFQHVFEGGRHSGADPGAIHGPTPLATFEAANLFLETALNRRLHISWPLLRQALEARLAEEQSPDALVSVF